MSCVCGSYIGAQQGAGWAVGRPGALLPPRQAFPLAFLHLRNSRPQAMLLSSGQKLPVVSEKRPS